LTEAGLAAEIGLLAAKTGLAAKGRAAHPTAGRGLRRAQQSYE
jgi:hypothetical protein